ncbi:hypothetical protein Tco_0868201 [Tanacetum coccineum]
MGIYHAKAPNPSRFSKNWQSLKHPKNSSILSNPDRAHICTISGAIQITPPPVFSTPPHILNVTTNERPPVTTTVFAATTPGTRHLLIIRNEDLRTELEYFSEDYDEEREMEPRPERTREVTPPLRTRSPMVHRQRERVVGFEEAPNREGSRIGRNTEGLFADPIGYVTPFVRWIEDYPLPDRLKMPSHVGSYDGKGDPDNFLHLFEGAICMQKWLMHVACHMFTYTLKDSARICQQKRFTKTHLVVHNIKQREGDSVRAFATRYTDETLQILGLHEDQCISGFVHGLRTRNLVEHLSTDLPSIYKGLMEKTYTWFEAKEVATNGALNDWRNNFERSWKSSWDNGRGQKSRTRFSPTMDLITDFSLAYLKVQERLLPRKK